MSREKQIEEMAKVIASVPPIEFPVGSRRQGRHIYALNKFAEVLYKAGYRKQSEGEWIIGSYHYECSICGYLYETCDNACNYDPIETFDLHFCPRCGAKMKGGGE